MAKMKAAAPQIEAIRLRYPDDSEASQDDGALQREKIHPVAGCLPMLIQLSGVFLALKGAGHHHRDAQARFSADQDLSHRTQPMCSTCSGLLPSIRRRSVFGAYLMLGVWP